MIGGHGSSPKLRPNMAHALAQPCLRAAGHAPASLLQQRGRARLARPISKQCCWCRLAVSVSVPCAPINFYQFLAFSGSHFPHTPFLVKPGQRCDEGGGCLFFCGVQNGPSSININKVPICVGYPLLPRECRKSASNVATKKTEGWGPRVSPMLLRVFRGAHEQVEKDENN